MRQKNPKTPAEVERGSLHQTPNNNTQKEIESTKNISSSCTPHPHQEGFRQRYYKISSIDTATVINKKTREDIVEATFFTAEEVDDDEEVKQA